MIWLKFGVGRCPIIIKFPTGFYSTVIDVPPDVPSNVTFTVSMQAPPRTQLLFVKTPVGLNRRKKQPRIYSDVERRANVSVMAFSVASSHSGAVASGMKQFETGQVLDFEQSASNDAVEPLLVPATREARHDLNLFDYDAIGLDNDVQEAIATESAAAYQILLGQLNDVIRRRADYEAELGTTQKLINEITKTLDGITSILEISQDNQTLLSARNNLLDKRESLRQRQNDLIVLANEAAATATILQAKVTKVAQLVR